MRDLGAELGVPMLVCLEGGYAVGALAASVVATLEALTGYGGERGASRGSPSPIASGSPPTGPRCAALKRARIR